MDKQKTGASIQAMFCEKCKRQFVMVYPAGMSASVMLCPICGHKKVYPLIKQSILFYINLAVNNEKKQ